MAGFRSACCVRRWRRSEAGRGIENHDVADHSFFVTNCHDGEAIAACSCDPVLTVAHCLMKKRENLATCEPDPTCRTLCRQDRGNPMKLSDIAQVIRSKNAGPRRLTLDVMFATDADYQRVAQSPALGAEAVGRLYGVPAEAVTVIPYPAGRAIKIGLARQVIAGDPRDPDR